MVGIAVLEVHANGWTGRPAALCGAAGASCQQLEVASMEECALLAASAAALGQPNSATVQKQRHPMLAMSLLQLSAHLCRGQNGRTPVLALPSSSSPGHPFHSALQQELQRLHSVIEGSHEQLLERLALLGRQLPASPAPKGAKKQAAAAAAAARGQEQQPQQQVAQLLSAEEVQRLWAECDQLAAEMVVLDDFVRDNTGVLARAAQAHEAAAQVCGGGVCFLRDGARRLFSVTPTARAAFH